MKNTPTAPLSLQKKRKKKGFHYFFCLVGLYASLYSFARAQSLNNIDDPNNLNEKQLLQNERDAIDRSRGVVLQESAVISEEKIETPYFSEEIDQLVKDAEKTIYKTLRCKEKFFNSFGIVRNRPEELIDTLKKDLKCINFPNSVLLTQLNVYASKPSVVDVQYLNSKLTSLTVPRYRFTIRRSMNAFKLRVKPASDAVRLVKGPESNEELTQMVTEEGFENYGEAFVFVAPNRIVLQLFIYNAATHKLQWKDYWAVEHNKKKVSFNVGLRLSVDQQGLGFTSLTTTIYSHAARIMDFGFYFDFGFYAREYENLTQDQLDRLTVQSDVHIGFGLGGFWTFNFVETILNKKTCCEVSLLARPGILIDVPIISAEPDEDGDLVTKNDSEVFFTIPVGVLATFQNFFISGDYMPLLRGGSVAIGYKF